MVIWKWNEKWRCESTHDRDETPQQSQWWFGTFSTVTLQQTVWCSKHATNFQFFILSIFLLFLLYSFSLSHFFSFIHSDILRYYWRIRIYGKIHSRTQLTALSPLNQIRKYQQINILCHLILNPYYSHQNTKPSKPHRLFQENILQAIWS
jgi:hypothetical protein